MDQLKYLKDDIRVFKKIRPSIWLGQPEYSYITEIQMTCGGGMGGAHWYEYVERLDYIPSDKIIKVRRFDGKEIMINTRWIVCAENYKLAKIRSDITEWLSCEKHDTWNKRGVNGIETYYVLTDDDKELVLAD